MSRLRAFLTGTFWTPCPVCDRPFGGYQWRDYDGHICAIPNLGPARGSYRAICPACTRTGIGCAVYPSLIVPAGHGPHCLGRPLTQEESLRIHLRHPPPLPETPSNTNPSPH